VPSQNALICLLPQFQPRTCFSFFFSVAKNVTYDSIRELLSIFDHAQEVDAKGGSADWETMKKCADTLRFLNGGTSVIAHFVCSRPCFFDATTFERDDELIKSANSMEVRAVAARAHVLTRRLLIRYRRLQ
jgi:hypothetical protein